jgi:hypothetical protein
MEINQMSELLNREMLLTREELDIVKVELDEKRHVFVRQMTGHERDLFEQSFLTKTKDGKGNTVYDTTTEDYRGKLAVVTICDDKGTLILKPGDASMIGKMMSAQTLDKIVKVAQEINGLTLKEEEEIQKN